MWKLVAFLVAVVTVCLVHMTLVVALFVGTPQCRHRVHASGSRSMNRIPSSVVGVSSSRLASTAVNGAAGGSPCRIKVIGVGGGGGNVVNRMIQTSPTGSTSLDLGVEMWVINTDAQALSRSSCLSQNRINIGRKTSRGLGAGGSPAVGAQAAEESREDIDGVVRDADLVFVTAGMGGGTGSGAAPIVAECARRAGALTVGVVTKPFGFEGRRRMQQAKDAINEMKDKVDTLIVVSNDKLLQIVPENTPLTDAFLVADDILRQGVVGISEIIVKPGLINVDFADVRTIMTNAGTALMGIGLGRGKTRAMDAALSAISSPLLDFPIAQARGIVFNIVGGPDMTLQEINSAAEVVYGAVDEDANIIFGALIDDSIVDGQVSITVLATGFPTDFFDGSAFTNDESDAASLPSTSDKTKTKMTSRAIAAASASYRKDGYDDDDDDEGIPLPPSRSSSSSKQKRRDNNNDNQSSDNNGGTSPSPSPRRFRGLRAFLRRLLGG